MRRISRIPFHCIRATFLHNLHYYQQLMGEMRAAIKADAFDAFVASFEQRRATLR